MAEGNNVIEIAELFKAFNPNEGAPDDGAKLPSPASVGSSDMGLGYFARAADSVLGGESPQGTFLERVQIEYRKALDESWSALAKAHKEAASKAIDVPSSFLSFARMTYMPDSTGSQILPWPGVHPEALRKIIAENLAPNIIINTRVDDVLNYADYSDQLWKPGWRIETREGNKTPSAEDKKQILEARSFLLNSATTIKSDKALERDEKGLPDFVHFLASITRDSLSYDLLAVSTDRDGEDRVVEYGPVPAANIRLVGLKGYEGDTEIFAVAVDEGGAVKRTYTRKELALYVRNPRTDPEYSITMTRGYGTPEITTAMKLIQIFQNVIEFNADVFNRSGVPHGLLLLTGNGWIQKQVDVLTRMWHNLKRGITKAVALPVLAAPKDGKVEVVDFSRIKGDEALYQDLLNLSIGCFCAVFRFPAHRLGYRISGHGPDSNMASSKRQSTSHQLALESDPGLAVLLRHIENFINQVLIWPRWANLRFSFTGKNPKEDARSYEARRNAMTFDEARAEADLVPLVESDSAKRLIKLIGKKAAAKAAAPGKDKPPAAGGAPAPEAPEMSEEDAEILALAMGMSPIDPNLSGVYQTLAGSLLAPKPQPKEPGNTMSSSKDPAKSEAHGKPAGVRRDSASEKS